MPDGEELNLDVEGQIRHSSMETLLREIVDIANRASPEALKDCCVAVERQGKEEEYLEALNIAIPWLTHLRDMLWLKGQVSPEEQTSVPGVIGERKKSAWRDGVSQERQPWHE